jgi:hypothetical protein
MKSLIQSNEVRLYPNSAKKYNYFNVHIRNDWFSKEFVYKVYHDRVVFKRPTLDYKNFPTRARKVTESWVFYLTLPDQDNRRLEIHDEDINEDQAILYL